MYGVYYYLWQMFAGQWVCTQCGKTYKWQGNLRTHQKVECGKEPSLTCSFCPYRTPHKSNLKRHIGVKHSSVILDDLFDSFNIQPSANWKEILQRLWHLIIRLHVKFAVVFSSPLKILPSHPVLRTKPSSCSLELWTSISANNNIIIIIIIQEDIIIQEIIYI